MLESGSKVPRTRAGTGSAWRWSHGFWATPPMASRGWAGGLPPPVAAVAIAAVASVSAAATARMSRQRERNAIGTPS